MKDTDKVTLTIGQLKKLIKESKRIYEDDNEDYSFKIFEGALEHEFVMMFEDGQFDGWSRQKIIRYEYRNVWQTVQEWCEFYDKSVDFQTVKQVALSRLGGEEGIHKYIENKVDDFIKNEVF